MQFTTSALTAILATLASAQQLKIPARTGPVNSLSAARFISGVVDLGNKEFDRGRPCNTDADTGDVSAVFMLEAGATLKNVIIGANQLEGIHCKGACSLINVWFRDVCEDAITIIGPGDVLIQGGGAQNAIDKVVQHNGRGTVTIKDYTCVNVGKIARSCGNCSQQKGTRRFIITGLRAFGVTADVVGINANYGDTATISGSCGTNVAHVCQEFTGVLKASHMESPKMKDMKACGGPQGKLATLPKC
ncbi:related to pectate lyase [Rhynchosporium secalis]|uniref:Pectate lyase n=1 Tax=Rhynchosporium secalis TaxID=38038 RepID=A0A1E1MAP2_RHYSE|nr:related to pectate lyase [Rhynchosporium secalis]